MNKGTCLLAYLPLRQEPRSGAEMVSCLLFGESYEVLEQDNLWLRIRSAFDGYEGWVSKGSYSPFIEFDSMVDALFVEASSNGNKMYLPCGSVIPSSGKFILDGQEYRVIQKLKTNHHLPMTLRILNTAKSFINTPYLWGGRSFMGIDCSGLVQVVFKVNGYNLTRDTTQQVLAGCEIKFGQQEPCDLVFFSRPGEHKVVHVGMVVEKNKVLHAGARVRINELNEQGLMVDGVLAYETICLRRIL